MPTKVSEKNLLLSLTLFATAIALLFSAKLFNAPVIISEKGILFILLGIIAVLFSIKFLKKAISRF
jgi:hypothetical protein